MKNVVRALICILISLFVLNCENDEKLPVQGKVQFALAITSTPSDGGRISSQSFPDGAYISLSIETASGNSVYSLAKINLIKLGDGYITAPLALTEGSYRLTDFFVMSAGGDVLYAIPKEGSPLAVLVTDPLPMNFSITSNGIVNLNIQVVDVDQQTPQDFGYVSFGVEVVGYDFAISILTGENNSMIFTSGILQLYHGNELVHTQSLTPKVNSLNFQHKHGEIYTLVIRKEGYSIRTREYKVEDLQDELQGKPLMFIVEPAVTLEIIPKPDPNPEFPNDFYISIGSSSPDLKVDWGDGTNEQPIGYEGNGTIDFQLAHAFDDYEGKRLFINITGNLASINDFRYSYSLPIKIQALDLASLTGLTTFVSVLTWVDGPDFIDFSKNTNLTEIILQDSRIKEIDVSNNPALYSLGISGTEISEDNLSKIIIDLHGNAVPNHIEQGYFSFRNIWPEQPQLTQESKSKLIDLRDNYGWTISPNPQ